MKLRDGERVRYDVLSLNIGSQTQSQIQTQIQTQIQSETQVKSYSIKPFQQFLEKWQKLYSSIAAGGHANALTEIGFIGGGAGGVELALAVATVCRREGLNNVQIAIREKADRLLPSLPMRAAQIVMRRARELAIDVQVNACDLDKARDRSQIRGAKIQFKATGPMAPAWLYETNLKLSEKGFFCVDEFLRAESVNTDGAESDGELGNVAAPIFAVGDCAEFLPGLRSGKPLAHSGVYAVRQAPVLLHNLRVAVMQPLALRPFQPQKRALYLISLGDRRAFLVWGSIVLGSSRLVAWLLWRFKRHIDRRYMRGLKR